MKAFIDNELKQRCRILFRDASIAGEGEHKIINFIKNFKHNEKVTHIIYGLDADLIMLSITTGLDNIFLLREKQHFEHKNDKNNKHRQNIGKKNTTEQKEDKMEENFNLLPIRKLKEYYWNQINSEFKYSQYITKQQFMNDFVFLCYFIGNDFLPHLKCINVHKNGVEMMIEKYLEQVKILKKPLLNEIHEINQELLLAMFKEINDNEEKYIEKNNRKGQDHIVRYYEHGWKHRYYDYYFYGRYNNNDIHKMCANYCDMLKWTTTYYFKGTNNWSWYYHYDCPPCFSDFYTYLQNNDINKIFIPSDKPYTQNQQLMIILPPQSAGLVPQKFRNLMFGRLKKWYPRKFELDKVDKHARYMWKPCLPEINDKIIKELVFN